MGGEQVFCYVGIKSCGCCEVAAVDSPRYAKDNAKLCAKLIRDGYTVERKPVEWIRGNLKKCMCGKSAPTPDLFSQAQT